MFNVRQLSSVAAYVTTFSELVDQLTTYSPNSDPLFFVTRFIDGLRPNIRAVVVMQRPSTFDTLPPCLVAGRSGRVTTNQAWPLW